MTASSPSSRLQVTVHRGPAGLAALREEWVKLEARLPHRRFIHSYSWNHSCLTSLVADPETVHFLSVRREGLLVAIFPFQSVLRMAYGIPLRVLQIPSNPHINLTDLIFECPNNSDQSLIGAVLAFLRAQNDIAWDVINIPKALQDSSVLCGLRQDPSIRHVCVERRRSDYLGRHQQYEEIEARIASSFKRNLRRLKRRAEKMGKLEYRSSRDSQELGQLFEYFLDVEASGWKGDAGQGSAIRCQPQIEAFYRSLMREYSSTNECAINILLLNGKCIAGQFCLLTDGTLYLLKIGYDESHAPIAPGYLLLDQVLRDYFDGRLIHSLSFVTDPPWTHLWRALSLAVYDCTVYNNTARGWLAYFWARGKQFKQAVFSRRSGGSQNKPAGNSPAPEASAHQPSE